MRIRSQRYCRIFNWKSGVFAGILLALAALLTSDTFLEGLMVSFGITMGFVVTVIWFRLLFLKKYFFCILCLWGFVFLCFHLPSVSCTRSTSQSICGFYSLFPIGTMVYRNSVRNKNSDDIVLKIAANTFLIKKNKNKTDANFNITCVKYVIFACKTM